MSDDFEKPNRIDSLEQKLYSPKQDLAPRQRRGLREKEYHVPENWEAPTESLEESPLSVDRSKKNWFTRFFVLAFVFFLVALGYVGFKFFFMESRIGEDVEILVNAPLTVGAGEVFAFDVLVQNQNSMELQTVDIHVEFPEGTRAADNIAQDYRRTSEEIGIIASGQVAKRNYSALLFGEEGTTKEVRVRISYRAEGSNLILEKEKNFDVVLRSTPVRLTVTNVKELTSGQSLSFNVELVSNSTQTLENVIVQASYPFGFTYTDSTLPVRDDKRTWVISKIAPREIVSFRVDGDLQGQNNEERYFNFVVGLENRETGSPEVVFSSSGTTVSLARAFLELDLSIDRQSGEIIVVDPDVIHDVSLSFKNNTNYILRNASLNLNLDGAVLSKNSVQVSEGFYQSANNSIVWDNSTSDRLRSISSGATGRVAFNFSGLGVGANSFLTNPELTMSVTAKANRNPDNQVPEIIENTIIKKVRFNTQASLGTHSEFRNAAFQNSGPIPPKVEQRTTYTAVVEILNTSNKLQDAVVTMKLPNYVTYDGNFAPSSENVSYDSVTRTLAWRPGTINEKTGYEGNPSRRMSFQLTFLPSTSQVGTTPTLVSDITLTGKDAFTGTEITKQGLNITTSIADTNGFYDSQVSR